MSEQEFSENDLIVSDNGQHLFIKERAEEWSFNAFKVADSDNDMIWPLPHPDAEYDLVGNFTASEQFISRVPDELNGELVYVAGEVVHIYLYTFARTLCSRETYQDYKLYLIDPSGKAWSFKSKRVTRTGIILNINDLAG